ncbi:MAG: DUF2270 domain-containing protein [Thermoanaerobaculia bacterium]|nr:DUF2270 domain-containing protein [Thermoanaerobaculia bacterium]
MVHFYRAEVSRSTAWRSRLDATTNWAVLTCAGMLSFAFAGEHHSHILLLLTNLIVLSYLLIEARRYRYFEVYRARCGCSKKIFYCRSSPASSTLRCAIGG